MKKLSFAGLLMAVAVLFTAKETQAQLVTDNIFLSGHWLEACVAPNGAWGNTVNPPAGYYTYTGGSTYSYPDPVLGTTASSTTTIDFIYDANHDGWTVAAPGSEDYYGPYFMPGTPFDGWSVQVDGQMCQAFYSSGGFAGLGGASLSGTNIAYGTSLSTGGCLTPNTTFGIWQGYEVTSTGDSLKIVEQNRIDTESSWDVVTIVFTNISTHNMTGLYYLATGDPDNDEPHPSGSFPTNNHVMFQNDFRHRVMVEARPPSLHQDAYSSLCTRDCRAKAFIYQLWPPPLVTGDDLDQVWGGSLGSTGDTSIGSMDSTWFAVRHTTYDQDIAYGLIYNLGNLAAGDSTIISFAWNFKDSTCTDSAFPDPVLLVDGVQVGQPDTALGCAYMPSGDIPVCIGHASDKDWSWASWTWSPSIGLASTTGITNTVHSTLLTGPTTYTITGNDSVSGMHSCNSFVLYLTVIPCFSAVNNGPICFGDTLRLDATGDSVGATYEWISPSGVPAGTLHHMIIYPATYADSGTWTLIRTVSGTADTAHTHVIIEWKPTLTLTTDAPLCYGMVDTLTLGAAPDSVGETFSWTGPAGFTSTLVNPVIDGFGAADTGFYQVIATSGFGCKDTARIDAGVTAQPPTPVLTGVTHYCTGDVFVPFTVTGYTGVLHWYTVGTGGVASLTAPTINTSYGGTYTFWVSQVIGPCESLRDSITVNVSVTPAPPPITGTSVYCQYATYVPPTAAGTNILWYIVPVGGTGTPAPAVINTAITGVTTLYATQSDSGCTSPRASFTITVNPVPLPPVIGGVTLYCQGDTPIPFTVTGVTGTLLWYTTATGGVGSTTPTPINTATPGVTTYWVSQFNGFCESIRASITVTVHPTPVTPVITGTATYCVGQTFVPLVATPTGTGVINWFTVIGGVGSLTPPTINTSVIGTTVVYADQTDSGCVSPIASFTVTVAPIPAPPVVIGTTEYCLNETPTPFTVLGVTGTVLWYTSATGGVGSTTMPTVSTATVGVTTYWFSQTSATCESARDSIKVHVHPIPVAPVITGPITYCQLDSFVSPTAASTGTGVIQWYTSVGGVPSLFVPVITTLVPGVTTIYANQLDSGCVSTLDSITVTVNAKPDQPLITDTPGQYCPGQTWVPFTVISGTGLLWYNVPTGGVGSATTPTINTALPGTTTYWVTQTVAGCTSDRFPVSITVYDSVIAQFTDFVKLGCSGDSVTFHNLSSGATAYEWSFGDGSIVDAFNPIHVYMSQGTFTVTLYAHSSYCEDSVSASISLIHPLSADFTMLPSDTVCQNTLVTFNSAVTSDVPPVYSWNFGDGLGSSLSNPTHTYPLEGVYSVTLSVTDFVPCTKTVTKIITVDSMTGITLDVTDSVLCRGTFATFTGLFSNIGNDSLIWNFGDGSDSLRNRNPVSYAFNYPDSFTVSVTATFRACPETSASRKIWVEPQPQIDLGPDTTICPGGNPILLIDKTNESNPMASWHWSTGQSGASIFVGAPGVYTATVDIYGCYTTDSVIVSNNCYMDIPNIFTPNGDGINDYFYPRQTLTKGLTEFKVDIYNRWGELIFESTSLDGRGWDGRFNGTDQPEGVYIYIIDAVFQDGTREHHQGNITLLR